MLDDFNNQIEINQTSEIEFKEMHGFIFVFETDILTIEHDVFSGEIKPVAIIYKENDDFYLAPLDKVDNINLIIEEFVKNYLLG